MSVKRMEWKWGVLCVMTVLLGGVMLAGCEDEEYAEAPEAIETEEELETEPGMAAEYQAEETEGLAIVEREEESPEAQGAEREQVAEREVAVGDNTLTLPLTTGGAIVVERKGETQARVGQRYEYTVVVANESEYPVHNVVLKQLSPGAMQIDRVSVGGRQIQQIPGAEYQVAAAMPGARPAQEHVRVIETQPATPSQQQGQSQQGQSQQQNQQGQQQGQSQQQMQQGGQQAQQGRQDQMQQGQPQNQQTMQDREWNIGMLPPGESREVTISGFVQGQESFVSCLAVDYEPTLCTQIEVVNPELQLQREFVVEGEPVEQAYSCDEIVAVYRLANSGSGTTEAGTIRDQLPQGLRTAEGQTSVEISFEPIEAGETVTKEVPLAAEQRLVYQGRAMATTGPLETYSQQDQIRIMHPNLELMIDGPQQSYLGRALQYEVAVRNTSDDPAINTQVRLQVPEEQVERFVVSTRRLAEGTEAEERVYDLGRLEPGETRRFSFSLEAAEPGEIQVGAMARAYCVDAMEQSIQTQVQGIPALRMEVIDRNDPVRVGEQTTYEISVKNQGSAEDLNVQVQAQLPENMTFVGGQGDTEVTGEGRNIQFGRVARIGAGEVYSWVVQAEASQAGKARFQLRVQSDATRRPVSEVEPTNVF